jgi:nucleotidyltransferase/DNA polymerase involved in DNA repair
MSATIAASAEPLSPQDAPGRSARRQGSAAKAPHVPRLYSRESRNSAPAISRSVHGCTRRVPAATAPHIVHVHIDGFFAAVEQSLRPRLRNTPVLVGRNTVLSASYQAQLHGISAAMPIDQARVLCPSAMILAPRFDRYAEFAERVLAILETFSPAVDSDSHHGFDLSFFGSPHLDHDFPGTLRRLQLEILKCTGLCVSIGAAGSRVAAAIAARLERPRGLRVITRGIEAGFLASLAAQSGLNALCAVSGVDPAVLRQRGIATIAELRRVPLAVLELAFGRPRARQLWLNSRGRDVPSAPERAAASSRSSLLRSLRWSFESFRSLLGSSRSTPSAPSLSPTISRESSVEGGTTDPAHLSALTSYLSQRLSCALRNSNRQPRSLNLHIRYSDQFSACQSISLPDSTRSGQLNAAASSLLQFLFTRPATVASLAISVSTSAASTEPLQHHSAVA